MSRTKEPALVLNLSDLETKRRLMQKIGAMSGLWEVTIKQRKLTRSLDANAYYWVAFCQPLAAWLTEQSGETFSKDDAHDYLKMRFLNREFINKATGELIEVPGSTTKLDTGEFSDYLEKCAQWMAEFCEIVVLPSKMFYEQSTGTHG